MSSADQRRLAEVIVSRDRAWNAWAFSSYLPNPDPILKGLGQDIAAYRDLRGDGHVAGCIRRRKAVVLAMESDLERGQAPARVHKAIDGMLADLEASPDADAAGAAPGLPALIQEALEGALYGYQPLEILWGRVGALMVPTVVQGKPPEWFQFDPQNRLRFRARDGGFAGELLPARKFLLARQGASYDNPYGLADLSLVFWPASFRRAGGKFWTFFVEKYGGAFMLGKLPRTAKPGDYDDLAERLDAMIQDAVGAIPDDGSVEILEAGKSASTDAHERYLRYWRSEITIALLGSNQGMESDSTRASASASLEVADDIRDGDARMVEAAVNQMIRWTVDANWPGSPAPVWRLREQEAIDEARPRRDKTLVECGVVFSRDYWLRTYGLEEGDLEAQPAIPEPSVRTMTGIRIPGAGELTLSPPERAGPPPALAAAPDELDAQVPLGSRPPGHSPIPGAQDQVDAAAAADPGYQAAMDLLLRPILEALDQGLTPEEILGRLPEWYGQMDDAALIALLDRGVAAAEAIGRLEVDVEDAQTPGETPGAPSAGKLPALRP